MTADALRKAFESWALSTPADERTNWEVFQAGARAALATPQPLAVPAQSPAEGDATRRGLLPCPFCGRRPVLTVRPDNAEATSYFAAVACFCGGYAACAHKDATASEADEAERLAREKWNGRAAHPQPKGTAGSLTEKQIERAWRLGFRHACDAERLNSNEEWAYKGANVIEEVDGLAGRTNRGDETGGAVKRFGWAVAADGKHEIVPATNGAFVWYDDYLTLWKAQAPAPAPEVPDGMVLVPLGLIQRAQQAINWYLEPNSPDEHNATMLELSAIGWPGSVPPVQAPAVGDAE